MRWDKPELLKHFTDTYSSEILAYADKILPNYLWVWRVKKDQYGYCTACKNEFQLNGSYRHKDSTRCPHCNQPVFVQSANISRKYMINEAYFVYYEKSAVDPNVIVARGIYAVEDFRDNNFRAVRPILADRTRYVFKVGDSVMLARNVWYSWYQHRMCSPWDVESMQEFEVCAKVYSELHAWESRNWNRRIACYSRESIAEAIKGTPFQYSMWQKYNEEPMVKFFDLYCKYPKAVEYLTKVGFDQLIDAKLTGEYICNSVYWNGKTVFKMLRVNRSELKLLRSSGYELTPFFIRLFQLNKRDKQGLSLAELKYIESNFCVNELRELQIIAGYTSLRKFLKYMDDQFRKDEKLYYSAHQTFITYKDYIRDCEKLEMNMKDDHVLFPKNLYQAHQNTIAQIKIKANEHLNADFKKRYQTLSQKYSYESDGLIIRPPASVEELINEGKTLNHCVGTYADRHAKGYCSIFFIRNASKPDKPYYTLELRQDRIIQTRGKNNCNTTPKIDAFLKAWTAEKLTKKKVKIMVPA